MVDTTFLLNLRGKGLPNVVLKFQSSDIRIIDLVSYINYLQKKSSDPRFK